MFYSIVIALCAVSYIFSAAVNLRYFIHMFQLNSYKPDVMEKWTLKNYWSFFIPNFALYVISVFCIAFIPNWAWIAFSLTFLISAVTNLPKKSYKVPLKYTNRVKRLIITLSFLYLVPPAALLIAVPDMNCALATAMTLILLSPGVMLFANLINRPLELMINRYYINDAKKILHRCPDLCVIGITGSFGKTSVKYFLDTLLSVKYNVLKTPGNFNTPLGIVKTIRGSLRATHDIFLCEMGAKNIGDIREICDIVKPKHGIITSVGPMHLESFKNVDNVAKTKFELADALPNDGMLLLNMDSEMISNMHHPHPCIAYGLDYQEGYYADDISISHRGSEFTVHTPDGETCRMRTQLIGRHNVTNIVGAIALCHSLGMTLDELKPAVRRLESVPHRLQLINKGDVSIIDDAYNSNPSGAKAAIEALGMSSGMKILVTPGMIELGDSEYELNKQFGEFAAEVCDQVTLVGEKQTRAIYDGLVNAGFPTEKIFIAASLSSAMEHVYSLPSGDMRKIILLENDLPDNY